MRSAPSHAFVATALAALLVSTSARAETGAGDAARRKEAQVLFDRGLELAQKNDVDGALAAFREAYAKYPSYKMLYNVGHLCARREDAPCAVHAYEQYLKDGGKEIPAKRRKEVEAEVKKLARTVARLTVRVDGAGAEIRIDDAVVGKSPLAEPAIVAPGAHKVSARAGTRRAETSITAAAGTSDTVTLELVEEKAPAPAAAQAKPSDASSPREEAPPLETGEPTGPSRVPWYVTGGLAAGTVLSGVLFAVAYGSYQDKIDAYPITRDDLDASQARARDLLLLTGALGTATVVSAGIATYLTWGGREPAQAAKEKPASRLVPARGGGTRVGVGPRGITIGGTF